MAQSEISRGQIRGLLLLMVIGPLIPTVILLRYMTDSVRAERAENREQIAQIYQQTLGLATASLASQWKAAPPTRAEAPARIQEYFRSALDPRATVLLRDENGRALSPLPPPGGAPVAVSQFSPPLAGWRAELFLRDPRALIGGGGDATAIVMWTVSAALAANLLIAGLAAFAVFRQMKMHELRTSTLAMVTHEFKTPLASMRVLLDTLREGRPRSPQQLAEYLELLAGENGRLSALVENFLAVSRLERGVYAFERAAIAPAELVAAALATQQRKLPATLIACRGAEDLPPLQADRAALLLALENLLDNARKYTGEEKRIAIETRREGSHALFIVEDNGIGVPAAERKKIFQRFYQVDQKLARRAEGCGLGLSLVQHIAAAHGGTIAVEDARGGGSRFTLRLPLA